MCPAAKRPPGTNRDGEQGFRTCADGVSSPNLKVLFETAARRCAEGAAELEAEVRGLGGTPACTAENTGWPNDRFHEAVLAALP
jgi:uncharacterized protein (TIGR02284 family)